MALSRSHPEDLPKDAVIISRDQALKYQWSVISNWKDVGDVWSLRYGPAILAALAAVTGIYVNNHYRSKLRLGNYGLTSTYLPIVVVPALFTVLTHKFFVQQKIVLDQMPECPLCAQVRAAAFQSGFGVCYPTILSPFAAFMFATRHFTYRLPSVMEEPREVFKLWQKFTRPIAPVLGAFAIGHAFIAMYITYKETAQSWRLQMKMQQLERMAEEEHQAKLIAAKTF